MTDFADAALAAAEQQWPAVRMIPCVIVTVTPLTVQLLGTTVTAQRILGCTYTAGARAVAFLNQPNMPIVAPIGA